MVVGMEHACRLGVAVASLLALACGDAVAQYPNRPIRFVVPVATGGLSDVVTRLYAQRLQERVGVSVVVDNKAGGAAIIGMEHVAKSAPDGYTLLMTFTGAAVVNPSLYRNLPYDMQRDFLPISLVGSYPVALCVSAAVPARTVREFIDLAKSKPGQLNYGSAGNATTSHLAMELMRRETGIEVVHVPYKGAAPAMTELIAGRLTAVFDTLTPLVIPQMQAGKIRVLGIASRERSKLVPDIPTLAEGGVKDVEIVAWYGVLVPAGTPRAVVERLVQEFAAITAEPATRSQLEARGIDPVGSGPDRFAVVLREETEKWRRVIVEANLKPD